jgi:predicted metal-dependent hydrolase
VALVGGLVMTAWDAALDPTSVAAGLWAWSSGTPSLGGIPVENYLAWVLGSAAVIGGYSRLDRTPRGAEPAAPILAYAAVALFYVVAGAPGVRVAAAVGMGLPALAALALRPGRRAPAAPLRITPEWAAPPDPAAVRALTRASFLAHPVKNHFVNSLHIVVAHGERYMIANLRRVRDRLSPARRREADWFIEQEGRHAAEHRRFTAQLGRLGYATARLDRVCAFVGQRLLPRLFGADMNLAITVAIEHWTASVAELVLGDRLLAELEPAARHVVEWHCFEELEHRAVAFDVFQDVCGSYAVRLCGLAVGVQIIAVLSLYGLVSFLAQDRKLLSPAAWREGLRFFYLRERLVWRTLPRAFALVRPGFHPTSGFAGVDRRLDAVEG